MSLPSSDSATPSGTTVQDSGVDSGQAPEPPARSASAGVETASGTDVASAQAFEGQGADQGAVSPLPPPSGLSLLVGNVLSLAFLAWIFKDPFVQGLHQGDSAFMGTAYKVSLPFCALCLAVPALLAVACLVRLAFKGFDPRARIWRLPPIAVVITVSLQLMFVRAFEMPQLPPTMVVAGAISSRFGEPLRTADGLLPTTPQPYADMLAETPPPFWKDGLKLTRWNAVVTEGCDGPVMETPSMVEPGTILVCLAPDRTRGWIVAVGLSHDVVGVPRLITFDGKPLAMSVSARKKAPSRRKAGAEPPRQPAVSAAPPAAEAAPIGESAPATEAAPAGE